MQRFRPHLGRLMSMSDNLFDTIITRLLSRVNETSDKSEGSLIRNSLSPAAVEFENCYFEIENTDARNSLDKATGDDLTKVARECGVERKAAESAVWKAVFKNPDLEPFNVEIDAKFTLGNTTFTLTVTEKLAEGEFETIVDSVGASGNTFTTFVLAPQIAIPNLGSAELTELLIPGRDEELDEDLRARAREQLNDPPRDGNNAQYLKWAKEYPGVGTAKTFPLWNGPNTLKIAITNSQNRPASSTLVEAFQNFIDPNSDGLGNGAGLLGCKVTVVGGTAKAIDVSATIALTEGYTEPVDVADALAKYLESITYKYDTVSYFRLGGALMDCPSIVYATNLTINGASSDIALVGDEIPVIGNLNLVVS